MPKQGCGLKGLTVSCLRFFWCNKDMQDMVFGEKKKCFVATKMWRWRGNSCLLIASTVELLSCWYSSHLIAAAVQHGRYRRPFLLEQSQLHSVGQWVLCGWGSLLGVCCYVSVFMCAICCYVCVCVQQILIFHEQQKLKPVSFKCQPPAASQVYPRHRRQRACVQKGVKGERR